MKYQISLVSLVFIVASISCSRRPPSSDQEWGGYGGYFPKMMEREYSLEYAQPGLGFRGTGRAKMVERYEGEETIAGKKYARFVRTFSDLPGVESREELLRITADGMYAVDPGHREKGEILSVPFPLTVGQKWVRHDELGDLNCQLESIEDISSPAGVYPDCLKITLKRGSDDYEAWEYLAKEIGVVKGGFRSGRDKLDFALQRFK
jgi:hypothetical protein